MVVPFPRPAEGRQVTLFERTTVQTESSAQNRVSTPESGWSRVYIRDPDVRDAVVRSLDGAAQWLKVAKCRSLLSEFVGVHGGSLEQPLASLGMTLSDYLRILVFEDGETSPQCDRPGILAFTAADNRVIRVCGRAFARSWQRDRFEGQATIVHEVLHSLGLGENPPAPRDITFRVKQLCW